MNIFVYLAKINLNISCCQIVKTNASQAFKKIYFTLSSLVSPPIKKIHQTQHKKYVLTVYETFAKAIIEKRISPSAVSIIFNITFFVF